MHSGEKEHKGDRTKRGDSGSTFKGFKGMFEMMRKCCLGKEGSFDCSPMMDRNMKEMIEMCCEAKADDTKKDGTKR